MKPRLIWVAACTMLVWFAFVGPAAAHGDLRTTRPEAGSTAPRVPSHISIDFTEPPTNDPEIGIVDGCRRPVALDAARIQDGEVHVPVAKTAQPGRFTVSYRIVSAVDGHPSKGSYNFKVAGKKDCSPDEPTDEETEVPAGDEGDEQAAPDPAPDDNGGGSTWLLLVGGGTLLLVVIALMLRRSGGGGSSA